MRALCDDGRSHPRPGLRLAYPPGVPSLGRLLAALPPDAGVAVVRDGAATVVAALPSETVTATGRAALHTLDTLRGGWWAGWLSYDLGRAVERFPQQAIEDRAIPDLHLSRYEGRLVLVPGAPPRLEGRGPGRDLLSRALRADAEPRPCSPIGGWGSSLDHEAWTVAVNRVLAHIADGDCYQVNLTRRLTTTQPADPRALTAALWRDHPAPHAALIEAGALAVVSASPERFLRIDGDLVETKPIKGTAASALVLAHSEKDHAENVMIVDLARNDLGRICEYGSITVPSLCTVEAHPGLHHLVSTVRGRLRPGVGLGAVIRATFAPASITGAPKPQVMQIIECLEPVRRGVYCGAVGWLDLDRGRADLNVAIRTFTVGPHGTDFGVGAGIVADSRADAEWTETELKADRLLALAGAGAGSRSRHRMRLPA